MSVVVGHERRLEETKVARYAVFTRIYLAMCV